MDNALVALFAFLALYYKIQWQTERLQKAKYKMFRNMLRYRKLAGSKKISDVVTQLEIENADD